MGVTPAAVSTHEETLYPFQREVIEQAFHCHVFCWYGNAEASANIVECEHGRLHVRPEYSAVELLRADGSPALPGETAEIVGTGFGNAAMPLLRYRTGDTVVVAEQQRCACGRRMPVVEALVGRLEDALWAADGHMVTRLDSAFKYSPHVVEAQLFQAEPGAVEVRLVTELGYTESEQQAIRRELALRFGPGMAIAFRRVESIPRDPSGKFRFVLSKVEAQ
jgi:phenylacetate-CoA ligase